MTRSGFWRLLAPRVSFGALIVVGVLMHGAVGAFAASYSFSHFGERVCGRAESGQLCAPVGVGVDAAGDAYVADENDVRVDKFGKSGEFLLAWGWGVLDGASELQVCTTSCRAGSPGSGSTEFELPHGLAVDGSGNVYVFDLGHYRVEKFGPDGRFLLMFGGNVNKSATAANANICTDTEETMCQPGQEGTANGWFGESAAHRSYIAVGGPEGDVYVGDEGRVQVFSESGVYLATLSLAGLSSTGVVSGLAVDSVGDVFVKVGDDAPENHHGAVPGVSEFRPEGSNGLGPWSQSSVGFDVGNSAESEDVHAIAVGGGHLYVGDTAGGFHVLEYDVASGQQVDAFGFGTALDTRGMAFSDVGGEERLLSTYGVVWVYVPPGPGPVFEPGSGSCMPEARGAATCEAFVNPEGAATEVVGEFVDEADFTKQVGGAACEWKCAILSSALSVGSGFVDQRPVIKLPVGTLVSGVSYRWRLVASSPEGVQSVEGTLVEPPAALVEGPWAFDVSSTGVTLAARVDPEGVATSYRLEYGSSTVSNVVLSGGVGAGEEYVLVSYHRQGLSPGTTYHFRLVTKSVVGSVETTDRTFTTQPAVALGGLPDGRGWELVSPVDKHGALIEPVEGKEGDIQAAASGNGVGYLANEPLTEDPSASVGAYVLSRRVGGRWESLESLLPSQSIPEGLKKPSELLVGFTPPLSFSSDMLWSVIEPSGAVPPSSLSAPATERTIFLHDAASGVWTPLVTPADVETGEHFGGGEINWMHFLAATPDLSHVVFESPYALTNGSVPAPDVKSCEEQTLCLEEQNLYEWVGGRLSQINVLPDGSTTSHGFVGRANVDVVHAVSNDGRWVAWEYQDEHGGHALYVRDMMGGKTLLVGGKDAVFQSLSGDSSRVFFLEGTHVEGAVSYDLRVFDVRTGLVSSLSGGQGGSAGVRDAVLGVGEHGTCVYFVATGVLAEGGVKGADNLYLAREEGGGWHVGFVATLSGDDEPDWSSLIRHGEHGEFSYQRNDLISSRMSGDCRFLAFMSDRSLTGYDNMDVVSGAPDEEVFEYDASAGSLVCVSCNPFGARPAGVFDGGAGISSLSVDRAGAWEGHWLAGSMSGWRQVQSGRAVYEPRNLVEGGRLFFESPDPLVPWDGNGLEDVYEYEPLKGFGGASSNDCTSVSQRFVERAGGCVGLISSGTSGAESTFYDSSVSGDDVFFLTASKLVGADYDNSFDVYDAHVCSVSLPCPVEVVRSPECDSGDSCKATPSPQPEIFGPAPSATFSGAGNVISSVSKPGRRVAKQLTRAQKLKRALSACRKKRGRRRVACERAARVRYAHSGGVGARGHAR